MPAEGLMARPKKPKVAKPGSSLKTIGIKATPEWAEWLTRAAKYYRTTSAGLIDRALAEWTAENGFDEAPPERTS